VGAARLVKLKQALGKRWRFASVEQIRQVFSPAFALKVHAALVEAGWSVSVTSALPKTACAAPPVGALPAGAKRPRDDPPGGKAKAGKAKPKGKADANDAGSEGLDLGCGACRGQHRPHTCASRGGKRKASKAKEDEDEDEEDEAKAKATGKRSGGKRRKLSVEAGARVTLTTGPHAGSRATVAGGKQGFVVVKLDDGTTVNVRQSGLNILGATPGDVGAPAELEEGDAAEGAADEMADVVAVEKAARAVAEAGVAPPAAGDGGRQG